MRLRFILASIVLVAAYAGAEDAQPSGGTKVVNWPTYTQTPTPASTATMTTSVSISTVSVQIIGANASRRGLLLYNNSSNSAYIAYDSTVNSATHMTFLIATFSTLVMPYPIYQGAVSAIRNSGTGAILITELK